MRPEDYIKLTGLVSILVGFVVSLNVDGVTPSTVLLGLGFAMLSVSWAIGFYLWRQERKP